ncbi:MAG: protease inhibitor Inh/omp19 family protein [Beijerinckiaceae bacterium]|nr:protease inhibitor Inh/omp19 family protein [Beijerinckiaceae bacterium]
MTIRHLAAAFALVLLTAGPSVAAEFEPVKPLDLKSVDPSMLKDTFGAWEIQDKKGRKKCRVTLKREAVIGGYQLAFAPGCDKTFPILGEITAWRLLEGWGIDLVDALRKTRIRFTTPDERYIALPEIDGIDTIVKR